MAQTADYSDRQLMLAARAGELAALDALFLRHHRRLYGFLARLTGDRHAAEDLVQEVFLKVLRFRTTYTGDGEFVAWLFRIARNVAADHYDRRRESLSLDIDANPSDDPTALDLLVAEERHAWYGTGTRGTPLCAPAKCCCSAAPKSCLTTISPRPSAAPRAPLGVRLHRALAALKQQWHALAGELQ